LNKPQNKGFTIIELIIVISLLSVFFLGLMTTYMQIQKLLNVQSNASVQGQQAEELYEILSHDIQNLVYEKWNNDYFFIAQKNVSGGSRIDRINFISGSLYSNPGILQSPFYNVTYFGKVNNDTGIMTLYRKEDMFVDYKETSLGVPIPVLDNISEFIAEFSLNGKDWQDSWDYSLNKSLPKFIKITIKYFQKEDTNKVERTIMLQTSPGIFM